MIRVLPLLLLVVFSLPAQSLAVVEEHEGSTELGKASGLKSVDKINVHNAEVLQAIAMDEPSNSVVEPQPILTEEHSNGDEDPVTEEGRDPFSITDTISGAKERVDKAMVDTGLSPKTKREKIPPMHLKGLVRDMEGGLAALLQVGKATHIVRKGDTVGLHDLGLETVIRIKEINRLNIVVETGQLGKLIVVR